MQKQENIEFPLGSVPIAVVSKIYGKNPIWIRAGIINGWLNIGLSATTPRLWLDGPILDRAMEAVDSEGTVYRENTRPCINAMSAAGHGRSQGWIQMTDIPADAEWVEIRHRTAGWSFRIVLPRGEEASA